MQKKTKTVEQQSKEFFDRERKDYEQRMTQTEIDKKSAVEPKEMFPEETSEAAAAEPETQNQENTQGE